MFCVCLKVANPHGSGALKQNACYKSMGPYSQVRAPHGRLEIRIRDRPAHAVLYGHVHSAKALLLLPVDVSRRGIANLLRCFHKSGGERVFNPAIAGCKRTGTAAPGIPALLSRLGTLEVGKNVPIAPAVRALFLPALEI